MCCFTKGKKEEEIVRCNLNLTVLSHLSRKGKKEKKKITFTANSMEQNEQIWGWGEDRNHAVPISPGNGDPGHASLVMVGVFFSFLFC